MGLYSKYIFPHIMDAALSNKITAFYRRNALATAQGNILEIGFGTGLNLVNYPSEVKKIITVDPNSGMNSLAQKRIDKGNIEVEHKMLKAEELPFAENSFDTVVSTWTLCSIPNVAQALAEINRVLKPNGRFIFLEHGLSSEEKIKVWQNRLNGLQKILGDGCHLNRNITELVKTQNWQVKEERQFYIKEIPKLFGYMYQGIAIKIK